MPQHIPLEAAGNATVFTPDSLKNLPDAPTFTLRVATWREKDHRHTLMGKARIRAYDDQQVREEVLRGLKAMWTEEQYEQFAGHVEAYWEAIDNYVQQVRDNPDLIWEYDAETEDRIAVLIDKVEGEWQPLADMIEANRRAKRLEPVFYFASLVADWTGLKTKKTMEGSYISMDSAMGLLEDLYVLGARHLPDNPALPARELYVACQRQMFLDAEEMGNSASPSPSSTIQPPSSESTTSEPAGKSPAPARSKKTRSAG